MPKIPIIPPRDFHDRARSAGGEPAPLSPEQAEALKAVEDRTARIDREVAVSRVWQAGVERLTEAEATPGGPPVGFARGFLADLDREREQLVTSLPSAAQEPLERDLLELRADFLDRAAQAEASGLALRRRIGLYDALDGYVAGVTKDPGQLDGAIGRMDSLIAGLGVPEDRQGPMRTYARTVLGDAAIRRMMDEPSRVEKLLADGLYDDVLPEDVKALRLKEAQDKAARAAHLTRERTVADLAAQAQEGAALDEAVLDAERKGTLSPAEGAYLRERNARAAEAAALRDARIRRAATARERLDPSNPEDRAAGNAYWESVAEVYAVDDPDKQIENELGFVERTGVLPEALEKKYRGALLSKKPSMVVQGASAIARLALQDPALVRAMPAEEVRRAEAIAGYAALGIEPDIAVEHGEKKVAAESSRASDPTSPREIQVAASDEPPVMSDATETGVPDDESGIQPDGSVVFVDPETGERTTIDPGDVDRLQVYIQDLAALRDLEDDFLRYYVLFKEGKIKREDATRDLRLLINNANRQLPGRDELYNSVLSLSDDIFDASDFGKAEYMVADVFTIPYFQNEIGKLLLSLIPIVGAGYSAVEAYKGFESAVESWRRGDTNAALHEGGMAALSAFGSVPAIGEIPRLARAGIKSFRIIKEFLKIIGRRSRFSSRGKMERRNFGKPRNTPNENTKAHNVDEPLGIDEYRKAARIDRIGQKRGSSEKGKREWSRIYGHDWPVDPETGRKLQGHHPDPLGDGGIQHHSNYIPMTAREHKKVHQMHEDPKRWGSRGKRK